MPDNTPSWQEAAIKVLKDVYGMGKDDERLGTYDFGTLLPGIRAALNSAVKGLVLASKPEEIEEGDGWDIYFTNGKEEDGKVRSCCPGDDIAYAHNTALDTYQANIIKAIDGKAE